MLPQDRHSLGPGLVIPILHRNRPIVKRSRCRIDSVIIRSLPVDRNIILVRLRNIDLILENIQGIPHFKLLENRQQSPVHGPARPASSRSEDFHQRFQRLAAVPGNIDKTPNQGIGMRHCLAIHLRIPHLQHIGLIQQQIFRGQFQACIRFFT